MRELFSVFVGVLILGLIIDVLSDFVKEYIGLILVLILIYAFVLSPHDKEAVRMHIATFLNSIFH